MTRPATMVALLVVVLLHALIQVGRTVASVISITFFVLTRPGFGSTSFVLLSSAAQALLGLVLATGEVLLVFWLWRGARRARLFLTLWLALSGVITLGGVVTVLTVASAASIGLTVLSVLQLALCAAALVLLRLSPTSAWLRNVSVRPAGPGL